MNKLVYPVVAFVLVIGMGVVVLDDMQSQIEQGKSRVCTDYLNGTVVLGTSESSCLLLNGSVATIRRIDGGVVNSGVNGSGYSVEVGGWLNRSSIRGRIHQHLTQ